MRKRTKAMVAYGVLSCCIIVSLFPIYWGAITALKHGSEYFADPPSFWPKHFTWENFIDAWRMGAGKGILDSAIVALSSTVISVTIGFFAGYSIARFKTGGTKLSFLILSVRMIPPVVPAIAYYLIIRKGPLVYPSFDSHLLLVCLYTLENMPFVVWIMAGFFAEIPPQLEEAAQLAGTSRVRTLVDIILPLSKPGLVAVTLFCLVFSWNEFLYSLFLTSSSVRTLPKVIPFLYNTAQEPLWGAVNATTIYSITPMIIMTFALQKYLIRGLTLGAVKG